jgi:hypothetical protein
MREMLNKYFIKFSWLTVKNKNLDVKMMFG